MFKVSGGFEKQIKLKNEIIKEGYGLKTFSWTFACVFKKAIVFTVGLDDNEL